MIHTPGPWQVYGDNRVMIGAGYVYHSMMIAEALYKHPVKEWSRTLSEAQGNAQLIAAAPDLLQASTWAVSILRMYKENHPEEWQRIISPDSDTVLTELEAAIHKAKGEE